MKLHELAPAPGSTHAKKRVGRGPGSGSGKTAGRGHKGSGARSGTRARPGFEGGQMPLIRRVPKRGFNNKFRVEYAVVNVSTLDGLAETVTPELLVERGLVHQGKQIKVLGDGEIKSRVVVRAHKFSAAARTKIEAAGGTCEEIA
jgi:large subunit ribosomal protein L15